MGYRAENKLLEFVTGIFVPQNRTIWLPEDLLKKADESAAFESLSLKQFLSAKLSEQFAGLDYLKQRAERASERKFRAALVHVPDVEPEE